MVLVVSVAKYHKLIQLRFWAESIRDCLLLESGRVNPSIPSGQVTFAVGSDFLPVEKA